jgi:hypothetical protein
LKLSAVPLNTKFPSVSPFHDFTIEKSAVKAIPKQDPDDIRAKMSKYQTFLQYPAVFNYFKEIKEKRGEWIWREQLHQ